MVGKEVYLLFSKCYIKFMIVKVYLLFFHKMLLQNTWLLKFTSCSSPLLPQETLLGLLPSEHSRCQIIQDVSCLQLLLKETKLNFNHKEGVQAYIYVHIIYMHVSLVFYHIISDPTTAHFKLNCVIFLQSLLRMLCEFFTWVITAKLFKNNVNMWQFDPFSAGTVFLRQNLASVDVIFWRIKTIPALENTKYL